MAEGPLGALANRSRPTSEKFFSEKKSDSYERGLALEAEEWRLFGTETEKAAAQGRSSAGHGAQDREGSGNSRGGMVQARRARDGVDP